MLRRALLLVLAVPAIVAAQAAPAPKPEIFLREPADGATVSNPVTLVFGLRNYGVAPAGIKVDNTGHFHVIIDGEVPAVGAIIPPNDDHNRHFGTGVIEAKLPITLSPGKHTIRVVLGDFEHKVISSELVSKPVTITVK